MPVQHSPPERQTRCQAVLTPNPRAPLDSTTAVPQRRAQLDGGPILQGAAQSRKEGRGPRRSSVPAPVGASQGAGGPTLAQSDQPVSCQSEPSLWAIMQQMTQIMANIQAASSSQASRPPAFKTASMNAQE
ncbi:hypothetical protein O181_013536 [Austropuccinia psidii MF-1]|uniref:Uncharacterized protein n=1 Tax=Austropuccinia psidii MF-1 TaxID=1389203 RepID=A0A9Q3BWK5_9BASI|nr:hypothetical protein [Austropuccinia psidii MF-1]